MSTDRPVPPEIGAGQTDGAMAREGLVPARSAVPAAGRSEVEAWVPAPREKRADPVRAPLRAPFSRVVRQRPLSLGLPPILRSRFRSA